MTIAANQYQVLVLVLVLGLYAGTVPNHSHLLTTSTIPGGREQNQAETPQTGMG